MTNGIADDGAPTDTRGAMLRMFLALPFVLLGHGLYLLSNGVFRIGRWIEGPPLALDDDEADDVYE